MKNIINSTGREVGFILHRIIVWAGATLYQCVFYLKIYEILGKRLRNHYLGSK